MSTCKKRKVEERSFQNKWEEDYLFVENSGKPLSLVCKKTVSSAEEYNIKRHYEAFHKDKFKKYGGNERKNVWPNLKNKQEKQVAAMYTFVSSQKTSLAASYEVALLLTKKRKSFREGELVKKCAIKMAEVFGDKKVAEKLKTVSLLHQTMARRVTNLSRHVSCKLEILIGKCRYFSIALDESTDVSDISQLLIFSRIEDEDFLVYKELLEIHPLSGGTKGSDIYAALHCVFSEYGGFKKCSCIATNGAKAMVGNKTGLVGLLKQN
ncbi:general transcription factor II-I repeat domain-containing protein 2-like [Clavelina lepadiformis]|uniref:general transcription factor II-I repeat domain-containing protein 2-like n=1 Tax=Clavelina lepadiformis TaxID=159417 RepID=UPI004042C0DA